MTKRTFEQRLQNAIGHLENAIEDFGDDPSAAAAHAEIAVHAIRDALAAYRAEANAVVS